MLDLDKKHVVLGITGSIACYKAAELTRALIDNGAIVDIVMTKSAQKFITTVTMQALSGRPVFTEENEDRFYNGMTHINIGRCNDLILIAPATANFIAKIANGMADDLLSSICLARKCPLFIAPAMNREMWNNVSTQRNINQLIKDNVSIIGPDSGKQACGDIGIGRLSATDNIIEEIISSSKDKILEGKKILITAGPTIEPIDPVRFISNRSSGKMGYAIARAAKESGGIVTMVTGPTSLNIPSNIEFFKVTTAEEMYKAVMSNVNKTDIFISVAAVCDWKIKNFSNSKIKKNNDSKTLPDISFTLNKDILTEVAKINNAPWCVGFAAETENLDENARMKLLNKKVQLIVGNMAIESFELDMTTLVLFDLNGSYKIPKMSKIEAARRLMLEIRNRMEIF
ncbi:phosphopantothenoylcysteine decarboxylase [Candidatus Kinetoplastibacterium blastocrithidii TCC012E]|uniref:Coenzyme A biosynthesis bifunctional protein CoaBC n=1 Tax=Candidatus Kinetoplastidibacterium blastocrithidiae TCC012E TaxID=1208922 RepID=M1M3C5_9PROT|nr:bifunctional phosphopantothenoylcysteine decarboxylase/phosphopantothenate--cysteine ligase CoaBC [Candidatus Kinetoplastibacterium blastocrithidii]AFZ83545.1 bifunctional phosphopantothenoylcysteine decarboxylase/phosphopantothenate synthase [Candidatus Kinetoplastibacterium blastocrithidii (ex Strigomonas culicis)]AGF49664.1 phosphopantothenoylcysteine decarboxylase [Candidatus Kinetoplastibacterium blastocrithidii TCC012E]